MAKLYITEYAGAGTPSVDGRNFDSRVQVPPEPAVANQVVEYTAPTSSDPFVGSVIRLFATEACFVRFGGEAATEDDQPLAAGVEYWRGVRQGDTVSVYDGSTEEV